MSNSFETDIRGSLGAVLLGGFGSIALSGMVFIQTFLYFRLYMLDRLSTKIMVGWLWALDAAQTCVVCASLWSALITHYGDRTRGDYIPAELAMTLFFTCLASFTIHCYYALMIYRLSSQRWYLVAPIVVLALLRVCIGLVSTIRCIQLRSWAAFTDQCTWAITTGYAVSAAIDTIIAATLCFNLNNGRKRDRFSSSSTNWLIDTFTTYTVNNGILTGAAAIISMICWFSLKGTLVFLGTHFLIGKSYTLSVLTSLNMRRLIRNSYKTGIMGARPRQMQPRETFDPSIQLPDNADIILHPQSGSMPTATVEKTEQYDPVATGMTATAVDVEANGHMNKIIFEEFRDYPDRR